jgi:uncharacterized protein YcaQ
LGFVQADPIRAPARAQDLTLRHRVRSYRSGDLDRRYVSLGLEEDFFVNYGFLPRSVQVLMHPRATARGRRVANKEQALLDFVRERGTVHPREVQAHFAQGTVRNYWGGSSNATTHLLNQMHYRGLLRVARRDRGIRIYTVTERPDAPADAEERLERLDRLVDVVVRKYAPVTAATLSSLVRRLRYGVPQWQRQLNGALQRSRQRLSHARVNGIDWYWPAEERTANHSVSDTVRLLAPFDPIVWDRRRFELLWGWAYRFEAYTPAEKRTRGYYALPLLWRDRVVGWGNVSVKDGALDARFDYVDAQRTNDPGFQRELDIEMDRLRAFLGLEREPSFREP